MELENLLQKACAVPLGPLSVTYAASAPGSWRLAVTFKGMTREVRLEYDPTTQGVVLACEAGAETSAGLAGAWVTDATADGASGATVTRLWLHGDGLSPALLLNALAALMQASGAKGGAEPATVAVRPRIIIPPPPTPTTNPVPIERAAPPSWDSFGRETTDAQPEAGPATVSSSMSASDAGEQSTPTVDTELAAGSTSEPEAAVIAEAVPVSREAETVSGAAAGQTTSVPEPELPAPEVVPPPVGKTGLCRECGEPFQPDHAFCTNCGARLDVGAE